MRLTRLSLNGFRGFPAPESFDLDADAVVIVGVNGQGKTSLFDGVLWGLTGRIPRLGDDARLVSMYSPSGEARVQVELRSSSGASLTVTRSFDGGQQQLRLSQDDETSLDEAARVKLLEALWPDAMHTPDGPAALTSALTRSVYLQQDLVREFVEADDEQQRFSAVSELVGAGRVTDLSLALERAKTAWSRATNVRTADLELAQSRLESLEAQLSTLTLPAEGDIDVTDTWSRWWERTGELAESGTATQDADSAEAPRLLDAAVKQIDVQRRSVEHRAGLLRELLAEVEAQPPALAPAVPIHELQAAAAKAEADVNSAREALEQGQAQAAEQRRIQVQLRETQAELRALAELALRHLGDTCPICGQAYDGAHTRHRLEELVGGPTDHDEATEPQTSQVSALAATVEELERHQSATVAALREAELRERQRGQWRDERDSRLHELGLGPVDDIDVVAVLQQALENTLDLSAELAEHRAHGEQLALDLTRTGERARRRELDHQVDTLRAEVAELKDLVQAREQTGEVAGGVLEGLRNAASEVVAAQLEQTDPLLQRIYATADPHPSFRAVRLLTRIARGRGRLNTAVLDPHAGLSSQSPETVLSSSQMNALAVSVFLALNLGVRTLPMQAVILDDPLQSLDDVNLLGLIDLLRRTKDQRQLLVSTHDERFGRLLARKLRPVQDEQRTRVIELSGWGPGGPVIREEDSARDPELLRIAA